MAAGSHFGWPKITFDRINCHFRSIRNFFSHKMAASGHFGWPKITFDRISRHFRSIRNFDFFFHKMAAGGHFGWPKIAFDHISRHFRSIRNFYLKKENHKMAAGGHFGWPQITFDHISRHIRSIRNFDLFLKNSQNGCRRPFWMTENHFRMHFSPFQINTKLFFFKMAAGGHFGSSLWAILDDRKSLSIAFLAISDQCTTYYFFFFSKWRQKQ